MSKLITTVHVTDKDGVQHIFEPGDEVPDHIAAKITNPKAWDDGTAGDPTAAEVEAKAAADAAQAAADAAQAVADTAKAAEDAANQSNADEDADAAKAKAAADEAANAAIATVIPSKVAGSTVAWAEYAKAAIAAKGLQIEIPEDAKRKDIIEALVSAGIPTE